MESILTSIKQLLGITEDYEHFDPEIIMHINSVFMELTQIGAGPADGFFIEDKTSVWTDFVPEIGKLEAIKSYIYLKVKLIFDPPANSTIVEAMKQQIANYEWRINVAVDTGVSEDAEDTGSSSDIVADYNKLINKPTINGEPLEGNYDEKDPTVDVMSSSDVDSAWSKIFTE